MPLVLCPPHRPYTTRATTTGYREECVCKVVTEAHLHSCSVSVQCGLYGTIPPAIPATIHSLSSSPPPPVRHLSVTNSYSDMTTQDDDHREILYLFTMNRPTSPSLNYPLASAPFCPSLSFSILWSTSGTYPATAPSSAPIVMPT